jgi:hypothetical protein
MLAFDSDFRNKIYLTQELEEICFLKVKANKIKIFKSG